MVKWRKEASLQHITSEQFTFVLDELEYYDKVRQGTVEIAEIQADGVWKDTPLLPSTLAHTEFSKLLENLAGIREIEIMNGILDRRGWYWTLSTQVSTSSYPMKLARLRVTQNIQRRSLQRQICRRPKMKLSFSCPASTNGFLRQYRWIARARLVSHLTSTIYIQKKTVNCMTFSLRSSTLQFLCLSGY